MSVTNVRHKVILDGAEFSSPSSDISISSHCTRPLEVEVTRATHPHRCRRCHCRRRRRRCRCCRCRCCRCRRRRRHRHCHPPQHPAAATLHATAACSTIVNDGRLGHPARESKARRGECTTSYCRGSSLWADGIESETTLKQHATFSA